MQASQTSTGLQNQTQKHQKNPEKFYDHVYPKLGHCTSSNNRISYVN